MGKRDFLSITDLSSEEVLYILGRAAELKAGAIGASLAGQNVAMLFEKPSLRTRVSFDVAVQQLGGHPIYLSRDEVGLQSRESVRDAALVLSRYVQVIVARTYSHATLEDLAANASVSVVNALSDAEHPCQVLGDLLTMKERFGRVVGLNVAFIGDGNNVAASLALAAAAVGANFTIASPEGYDLPQSLVKQAQELGGKSGASIHLVGQPQDAVSGADVVYTDVWVSMGQENEAEERLRRFREYQVTPGLVQCAGPEAIFMHPLPAHHGEEIEIGMLDHSQSVVFDQAENRLHAQKAVLELIMSSKGE